MKFTYDRIKEFSKVGQLYVDVNDNKLSYAIKKVFKGVDKLQVIIDELTEDARIDNCMTNEKGKILRDEKGRFEFDKEGLKKLNKEIKRIREMEFEIEPYYAPEFIIETLTYDQKESFAGFVIPEYVEEPIKINT